MTCKNRPRYNLWCVWWDIKPCSINQSTIEIGEGVSELWGPRMGVFHWLWQPPLQQVSTAVLSMILSSQNLAFFCPRPSVSRFHTQIVPLLFL